MKWWLPPQSISVDSHLTIGIFGRTLRGPVYVFFLYSGFGSSLSPLLCFITVFVYVFLCDVSQLRQRTPIRTKPEPTPPVVFSTDCSKALPLLQLYFVARRRFHMCHLFCLCWFIPHFCFFWYVLKAVFYDCDISWVSSLIQTTLFIPTLNTMTKSLTMTF